MSVKIIRGKDDNKSAKIILLGDSGVGKTSLLKQYTEGSFEENGEKATVGLSRMTIDRDGFEVDLWDTAGQERYRSLANNYIRDSDVVIIVFDSSVEKINFKSSINEFFKKIADNASNSSVIIAANKSDTEDNNFLEHFEEYNSYYIKLIDFINSNFDTTIKFLELVQTSAKTGEYVEDMFETAIRYQF